MTEAIEKPEAGGGNSVWGSDVIAEMLQKLGIKYVALNPGASFRGLHDSIVNRIGNRDPQMILCLHEETAVAVAHGYAKVAGEPMAVILHSNVGLMHGSMAIFNAFVDRVPVLVFGATGPVDAARRRPWIDWLHTAQDQGALVRTFIKWDDQPASVPAMIESLLRANQISRIAPQGPTYVCFDAALQEQRLDEMPVLPDVGRYKAPRPARPDPDAVSEAAALLKGAKSPVILAGLVSRDTKDWARRVALAEKLNAKVLTDSKVGAAFPTDHRCHAGKPTTFLDAAGMDALKQADVVLSLNWIDPAGAFKQAIGAKPIPAKMIQASVDFYAHNGFGKEHQALPPADVFLASDPDVAVADLCAALGIDDASLKPVVDGPTTPVVSIAPDQDAIDIPGLGAALGEGLSGEKCCLIRLPLGWDGGMWHYRHPLDYLGYDGGGGIGSGPGMSVGAALALKGTDRLPVAVLGDGDFMMCNNAVWTAVHYRIPLLVVIGNNNSFYNDEVHQERVANERSRPVENKWIGQRVADPDIDFASLARSQGAEGIGPVRTPKALAKAVKEGVALVKQGKVVVIDARVLPGYSPAMAASVGRSG